MAMLTFKDPESVRALLMKMSYSRFEPGHSFYDAMLELAWAPENNMLLHPIFIEIIEVLSTNRRRFDVVPVRQELDEYAATRDFQMTLARLVKFAFRGTFSLFPFSLFFFSFLCMFHVNFLLNVVVPLQCSKFCFHVKLHSCRGKARIAEALKSVKRFSAGFLCGKASSSLFSGRISLAYAQSSVSHVSGSTYCIAFHTKSRDVADVYSVSLRHHLDAFFMEKGDTVSPSDSSCEPYNQVHDIGEVTDGERGDWREMEFNLQPFCCEEAVFYFLVFPYLFYSLLPDENVDRDLVRTITRTIVDIATGCSNFFLCRDNSYDTLFSDEKWMRHYLNIK
jgi:hypothetical protein